MDPAQVERKLRQLDNDVGAIYGMLYDINIRLDRHDNRFEELSTQMRDGFADIGAKLDRLLPD
jgi:hypothetical protein